MTCARLYDFVEGTKITLPKPLPGEANGSKPWDILRPNARADSLVARHIRVLAAKRGSPLE